MPLNATEAQATHIEPPVPPAVTGWLLFLCLLLTLVFHATALYHILTHTLPSLINGHSPGLTFLLSVYCAAFLGLAVLSFIAGLKLWLVRPDAVRFARRLSMTAEWRKRRPIR